MLRLERMRQLERKRRRERGWRLHPPSRLPWPRWVQFRSVQFDPFQIREEDNGLKHYFIYNENLIVDRMRYSGTLKSKGRKGKTRRIWRFRASLPLRPMMSSCIVARHLWSGPGGLAILVAVLTGGHP